MSLHINFFLCPQPSQHTKFRNIFFMPERMLMRMPSGLFAASGEKNRDKKEEDFLKLDIWHDMVHCCSNWTTSAVLFYLTAISMSNEMDWWVDRNILIWNSAGVQIFTLVSILNQILINWKYAPVKEIRVAKSKVKTGRMSNLVKIFD